jgi:hypothetical protein
MKTSNPPAVATWILEHLTLRPEGEALAGDLLEQFRTGRRAGWYWRQVLAAVAIGFFKEILRRRPLIAFVVLWNAPIPALWFYVERFMGHSSLLGSIWSLPWPWSTICEMALIFAQAVIPLWTGMVLYLVLHSWLTRCHKLPKVARGLWVSVVTYIVFSAVVFAIPQGYHLIDIRTATAVSFITDPTFILLRLPAVLALLVSIWVALPETERKIMKTAA